MENQLFVPAPDLDGIAIRCSISQAVAITGRSRRTVQRWARRRHVGDASALALLQTVLYGRLPPPWDGWRVIRGALVSPEGESFTSGDLRAAYVNAALVRELQARIRNLERQLLRQHNHPLERIRRAAGAIARRN